MKYVLSRSIALCLTAALAASASADPILVNPPNRSATAVVTADNHYAIYTGIDTNITLIGRNELGAGGSAGTYNWSRPETWSFVAGDFLYLAGWSDGAVAQGLLAQITVGGLSYHSGDSRWQVYKTGQNKGTNSPAPTGDDIEVQVGIANSGNLWASPYVGGNNGISPWSIIPGIASNIPWMWANSPNKSNPLLGGSAEGEYLLFRMAVPTSGTAAVFGLGLLLAARRRRNHAEA